MNRTIPEQIRSLNAAEAASRKIDEIIAQVGIEDGCTAMALSLSALAEACTQEPSAAEAFDLASGYTGIAGHVWRVWTTNRQPQAATAATNKETSA